MSLDGAPIPDGGWSIYNSYSVDPPFQIYLTSAWTGILGIAIIARAPAAFRYLFLNRRYSEGWQLRDAWRDRRGYQALEKAAQASKASTSDRTSSTSLIFLVHFLHRVTAWTLHRVHLSVGQLLVLLCIPTILLSVILPESDLSENPNRLGFLAVALLPPIFLLASKASALPLLTGYSYDKVSFLHRWTGRALFVLGLSHGSIWISQWVQQGSIADHFNGETGMKEIYGTLTLSFLALLVFSSLRPVRRYSYPLFFACHIVGIVGFLVSVAVHTIYSHSWLAYGVVPIYGADLFFRFVRFRVHDGQVTALPGGAIRIEIFDASSGWRAAQHAQLRIFFTRPRGLSWHASLLSMIRPLEQHPFTIARAPPAVSVLPDSAGLSFLAKARKGQSWTADLHAFAAEAGKTRSVQIMVEGLYGSVGYEDPCTSETLCLIAGGSGATFTLGLLDEVVGRVLRGFKGAITRHISFLWAVKSAVCIEWYGETLDALIAAANASGLLRVDCSIYVTSSVETSSYRPTHCKVFIGSRPDVAAFVRSCVHKAIKQTPDFELEACSKETDVKAADLGSEQIAVLDKTAQAVTSDMVDKVDLDNARSRGFFVGVCGPHSMMTDVKNATARISFIEASRIGGLHVVSEAYDL